MKWKIKIKNLEKSYTRFFVFFSDPGGYNFLKPVIPLLGSKTFCIFEGWASKINNNKDISFSNIDLRKNDCIFLTQQTDIKKMRKNIKILKKYDTYFFCDSWNEISTILNEFEKQNFYPKKIFVSDKFAKKIVLCSTNSIALKKRVYVFGNPFFEIFKKKVKKKFQEKTKKTIYFILDPETKNIGYTWKESISYALKLREYAYKNYKIIFRPHPKQEIFQLKSFLEENNVKNFEVTVDSLEYFFATSEEIWGITSVLCMFAIKLNKIVKLFQPNRNNLGKSLSNSLMDEYIYGF
tara:strand:- start:242 stop:1123 length:882 start_codon:yes stop_codon:yes gene_type:complete